MSAAIRVVDYRDGPHEDVAALWRVENEVEVERRPDNGPKSLEAYLAEARAFPAYFRLTSWLAEDEGEPIASAGAWSRDGGDPDWIEGDIWVRRAWRRQGHGTRLLRLIAERAADEGRSRLLIHTTDQAPSGEPFVRSFGGRAVRTSRRSELRFDDVDWDMVRRWADEGPRRAPGYSLEFREGPYEERDWDDAVALRLIMNTAPVDDIEIEPREYKREQVPQDDEWMLQSGKRRWTLFARLDSTGECVGGTNVFWSPEHPDVLDQGDTGVHPDHRGHALGKWLKAAMLLHLLDAVPGAAAIRTGNAYSNAPMLGINDALGFKVTRSSTEWAFDVGALLGPAPMPGR